MLQHLYDPALCKGCLPCQPLLANLYHVNALCSPGMLAELQGIYVPRLQAAGYWKGNSGYVLATEFIAGACTMEEACLPSSSSLAGRAEEVGTCCKQPIASAHLPPKQK